MFKKLFAISASVILLAGCSLFGGKSVKDGAKATEADFAYITGEMNQKWAEKLTSFLPEFDIPEESKTSLDASVAIDAEEVGQVNISLNVEGQTSMKENASDSIISMKGEITSDTQNGSANITLDMRTVKDKLFLSLLEGQVDLVGQDAVKSMFDQVLTSYVGQWYGGTASDLEELLGSGVEIQDFNYGSMENFDIKNKLKTALNDVEMWKFKEGLETKDGMLTFKVELDKNGLKTGLMGIVKAMMVNSEGMQAEMDQMEKDIEQTLAEIDSAEGVLAISQENPEYFTFQGTITVNGTKGDLEINWLKDKKNLIAGDQGAKDSEKILVEINGDKFTISSADKSETILSGVSNDKELNFLFTPNSFNTEEGLKADLSKNNGTISGTIEVIGEDLMININKLKYSTNNLDVDFDVQEGGKTIVNATMTSKTEKADNVNITEPEAYKSFSDLMSEITNNFMLMQTEDLQAVPVDNTGENLDNYGLDDVTIEPITLDDQVNVQ